MQGDLESGCPYFVESCSGLCLCFSPHIFFPLCGAPAQSNNKEYCFVLVFCQVLPAAGLSPLEMLPLPALPCCPVAGFFLPVLAAAQLLRGCGQI